MFTREELQEIQSFSDSITDENIDEKLGIVEICCGRTGDGRDFYAYLCMYPSKYPEYTERKQRGEPMRLEEYGRVLYKDWGYYPSEAAQLAMKQKYNISHTRLKEAGKYLMKHIQEGTA